MFKLMLTLCALALVLAASGCASTPNVSVNSATETPARTPRATFTPRATATEIVDVTNTPEATATSAATDTPAATSATVAPALPTATKKPVVNVQPTLRPQPPAPTQPPAPPKPTFLLAPDGRISPNGEPAYQCPNASPVYEVIMTAKRLGDPPRPYSVGYWFGAFSGGVLLKDYAGKDRLAQSDNSQMSGYAYGSNCQRSGDATSVDKFNGKLDLGDVVRGGTKTMVIRFVRSNTDLTPISQGVTINFNQSGAWWLYFGSQ